MTLIRDAASVVFAYGGTNRYFMWAINTNDRDYPLVRRHVYSAARIRSFPTHESTLSQKNSFSATKGASV